MPPALKNNAAAGYQGPVKIEFLKSAGLLFVFVSRRALTLTTSISEVTLITLCTGLIQDGVATMQWIRSQSPYVPLYIWGHSLGSG